MIVAVGSLKGSPGATTVALGLADRWPADGGDPLVVEADPDGGDLAGRFSLAAARGLVSLAAAARRPDAARSVDEHVHELPGGLGVVVAPPGAEQARQVLAQLAGGGWSLLWSAARAQGRPVIVDVGRFDPTGPAGPALGAADVVLLVVRGRTDELAQLAARLPTIRSARLASWFVVVVEEAGRSAGFPVSTVSRALGERVLGPVPHDPAAAAVLAGARRTRGGIGRSRLGRAVAALAGFLADRDPDELTPVVSSPVAALEPAAPAAGAGWLPEVPVARRPV
ncbi:hypothetical protein I6A60_38705 [Frankia sp. AgB1.9]|uniref:MinD/ParA family ATP-binding protein n=1 Tax=unclassified Frankia TaxID=2632575 RepID=UPI00193411BF|nr:MULTISPECIES: hypothetical protein [unclassified Frankia]MBL7487770.1 hypothetical protein [Frankia sp. AgW1.1]MBL7553720.1 hypothetical protein [Frankia sp. AgB1.9]MBL7622930.1 hypothetical protein [Frankia sp. AgB1.8]